MNFADKFLPNELNRRTFLKLISVTSAGFSLGGLSLPLAAESGGTAALDQTKESSEFGHFITIATDNTVTVTIKHLDKGQGVTTGLTAIVAEELDADWAQMRWKFAPADASRYNNLLWGPAQGTGGSTAIANSWMQLRQAAAAARQMLVAAAANEWQVDPSEVSIEKGMIKHASGKSAGFGDIALAAAEQAVPQSPGLKEPEQFRLIGTHMPRIDSPEKSRGKARYTIDVRLPEMLYAAIAHPPKFGAKLTGFDKSQAMTLAGVKAVVETPRGVAVIADSYWTASEAKKQLQLQWDESDAEQRSSAELLADFQALAATDLATVRQDGDANAVIANSDATVDLEFQFPYLSHAQMEPLNCVVQLSADECHIWTGSQIPTADQFNIAQLTNLALKNIHIHTQFAGGSFGRRAAPNSDYLIEAVMIAQASDLAAPINLQWSREDDMQAGYYRPMALHRCQGAVKGNQISAWKQGIVCQSILRGTPFEAFIQGEIDPTITEGSANLPYDIANIQVAAREAEVGVPVLWWRSVGHTHNAYATEVFFDELARKAGQDPVEYRLALLEKHPRHSAVVKLAAEKAGWGKSLPSDRAQGVAVHESFNSFVAMVAEVSVAEDGLYRVEKITCAVDCGIAITPDVIKAQMEGGIAYGIGSCMGEKITLRDGAVEQSNFYNYFPLRMNSMPEIEVHIVASNEPPTGVGEPGVPPAAPAIANALRNFTAAPLTVLPIGNRIKLA